MTDPTTTATPDVFDITRTVVRETPGVYALRVKGDGMIDALVNDGDIVFLRRTATVENGDMAAVWIKSQEVTTLKLFFDEGDRIRLQPQNRDLPCLYFHPTDVAVQGKMIAVIRHV